jgi:hypothetical protein
VEQAKTYWRQKGRCFAGRSTSAQILDDGSAVESVLATREGPEALAQLPSHLLAVTPAAIAYRTRDLAAPASHHGRRSREWEAGEGIADEGCQITACMAGATHRENWLATERREQRSMAEGTREVEIGRQRVRGGAWSEEHGGNKKRGGRLGRLVRGEGRWGSHGSAN